MNRRIWKGIMPVLLLAALLHPGRLWACAACYGQSDGPLARGMNWGIFSLLGVVVCVLASIATFFVFLGKRSAAVPAPEPPPAAAPGEENREE
jgi:hypothetical protein